LISALFPSVDGAITALTSSFCIDILGFERNQDKSEEEKTKLRKRIHLGFAGLFIILVFIFRMVNSNSIVNLIIFLAAFTYGPLLGLFSFGILTKRRLKNRFVWLACVLPPFFCYILDFMASGYKNLLDENSMIFKNLMNYSNMIFRGYEFGYEMLIINGGITFILLSIFSHKSELNHAN
jgi:hypothetical protein